IAQAVLVGNIVVVVLATLATRFENYSRGVIVIDGVLTLLAVATSRSAMRLFRDVIERLTDHSRRAALLGPEALKDVVARGIAGDRYTLTGVIAQGAPEAVVAAAKELNAEVVVVALPIEDDDPLLGALRAANLEVRRIRVVLE